MRLNRYLASCGAASRRGAEALILAGRVKVNGAKVTELATFVEPGRDRVQLDGRVLDMPNLFRYYLLHKPVGVVTTSDDPESRTTVVEFVPTEPRVFAVGRLDQESSGALLLTNDGALAHRLIHPRYHVEKEYEVWVEGTPSQAALRELRDGVNLEGRPTQPAGVEQVAVRSGRTLLRMVITEGRKRQIRRMCEAVEHPVTDLKRVRIGPLPLGNLESGTYRDLTEHEVAALRKASARPRRRPLGNPEAEARRGRRRPGTTRRGRP